MIHVKLQFVHTPRRYIVEGYCVVADVFSPLWFGERKGNNKNIAGVEMMKQYVT